MVVECEIDIQKALKEYFGYNSFRGLQQSVVENVLLGNDTFVIMPTGAGKSLCYQLPAIVSEGMSLVISPLIALMKNQVDQMTALGIEAGFLNSSMTRLEQETVRNKALAGILKLLYVAPETLVREEFLEFLRNVKLSFVAIDEAHCISEWGHDFRPEYRRIRPVLNSITKVPLIALTATATPKVQFDILENLSIAEAQVYKSSFNRENLYYEIREKKDPIPEIVRYIKQNPNKSGIIYCLSRKKVEEIAEILKVNGIKSVPYHAGLDSETRSRHQDMFLSEDVQVVVATIAFGMGIDKPDVRFVIHYDVPKSIESYYQETGRAGRDGLEGNCILFYDFNDIIKLEKFMKDKPLSEREAGKHLLYEMAAFCESGICRRKLILHYFGETYETNRCNGMCDNCRNPKETYDATKEAMLAVQVAQETGGKFGMNYLISVLRGSTGQQIKAMGHDTIASYGKGSEVEEKIWKSIFTQLIVHDYLIKDITDYGVIRVSAKGEAFLKRPEKITLVKYTEPTRIERDNIEAEDFKVYDEELFEKLRRLRKEIANKKNLPPYIIFQDTSLEDMAIKYPISMKEFENIIGVGAGKARKFAAPFIELIKQYVEENEIERPIDYVVKTQGKNSADKLYIIQQIDRRTPLNDIANERGMAYDEVLEKVEQIIYSGTKLNIDYYVEQVVDQDKLVDIFEYFRNTETDCLIEAQRKLGNDYTKEEIQLVRAKFYSELAN